jgi:hypothetical protein
MANYNVPNEIKYISGEWKIGETVTLCVDGTTMQRKVNWHYLQGEYVTISGLKIGRNSIEAFETESEKELKARAKVFNIADGI